MYNFPKIQFGEKAFYVVDDFEYEGMDISKFDGDIEINFIFKRDDGKFENVVDDKLFNKLLNIASKRLILNQNKYFQKD